MRIYILYIDGQFYSSHLTHESASLEAMLIQVEYPEARVYIGSDILQHIQEC